MKDKSSESENNAFGPKNLGILLGVLALYATVVFGLEPDVPTRQWKLAVIGGLLALGAAMVLRVAKLRYRRGVITLLVIVSLTPLFLSVGGESLRRDAPRTEEPRQPERPDRD